MAAFGVIRTSACLLGPILKRADKSRRAIRFGRFLPTLVSRMGQEGGVLTRWQHRRQDR